MGGDKRFQTCGKSVRTPSPTIFVEELCELFWDEHCLVRCEPTTRNGYASQIKLRVKPNLFGRRLGQIDKATARSFISRLIRDGHGKPSVNHTRAMLSRMWAFAVEYGHATDNPFHGIPKFKTEKKVIEVYSIEEVVWIADHMRTPRDRAVVIAAALTGMRESELLALRPQDVRDDHIRVEVALDPNRQLKPTKAHRQRTVPLLALVKQALADLPRDGAFMFPNRHGLPLTANNFYTREYKPACKAAGLPRATFHELRHTFASTVIASGASALAVMKLMGHKDISTTYNVYGHLLDSETEQIVARLDALTAPWIEES